MSVDFQLNTHTFPVVIDLQIKIYRRRKKKKKSSDVATESLNCQHCLALFGNPSYEYNG